MSITPISEVRYCRQSGHPNQVNGRAVIATAKQFEQALKFAQYERAAQIHIVTGVYAVTVSQGYIPATTCTNTRCFC